MLTFSVNGQIPGAHLNFDSNEKLSVIAKAESWTGKHGDGVSKLQIIKNGEVIKEIEASRKRNSDLELDFEYPVGQGFWMAAKAINFDGSKAHTTPVYVTRNGMRFWKHDQVERLIAMCENTLQGMTDEMDRFEAIRDTDEYDYWNLFQRSVFRAIDDRRVRIHAALEYYAQLKNEWERENQLRQSLASK